MACVLGAGDTDNFKNIDEEVIGKTVDGLHEYCD
jgi:hypothetical protein